MLCSICAVCWLLSVGCVQMLVFPKHMYVRVHDTVQHTDARRQVYMKSMLHM